MKKKTFYTEFAYLFGLLLIALSCALLKHSNFGVSMIVAPAYLLHLYISPFWSAFTFGMAEYCLQALLIVIMAIIIRRCRVGYLFSFVTAVVYGLILDGFIYLVDFIPSDELWQRILLLLFGMVICCIGVAMMFKTYISPEAYELIVMETSSKFKWDIHKCKWCFDCICCGVAIILSFIFFGKWRFDAIGVSTLLCAALNGYLIGRFSKVLDKYFVFKDGLPLRKFFTGEDRKN